MRDMTRSRWQAAVTALAPAVFLAVLIAHPPIPGRLPNDIIDSATRRQIRVLLEHLGKRALYDVLDPSTWPLTLFRGPQVARASARFSVKNARFFAGDEEAVPRHVVTQGIGTILGARHLVLMASGAGKAGAVAQAVEGPVTAMVPASALQLHSHATVVVDEAAAASLRRAEYYRETWQHKPSWQGL
jgi:hypothetical protein